MILILVSSKALSYCKNKIEVSKLLTITSIIREELCLISAKAWLEVAKRLSGIFCNFKSN